MSLLSRPFDTAPEAWEFAMVCYRRMGSASRADQLVQITEAVNRLHSAGQPQEVSKLPNRSFDELLVEIVRGLDQSQVPFMVVGSFASAFHGVPRSTQDLDIVVDLDAVSLARLLQALQGSTYYVSPEAAADAVRHRSQFNLIDPASGWKVDFIVKKDREFSQVEFERRQDGVLQGQHVPIATAEDTIIGKLLWAKSSQSERQLRDVAGILDVRADELDRAYLESWVAKLGLQELLDKAVGPW